MAQCDYNKDVIEKILAVVGDIADRVGLMDGKVDAIATKVDSILTEVTTDTIWQVCGVCSGVGYFDVTTTYNPVTGTYDVVRKICANCNGTKRVKFGEQQPTIPT